MDRAYIEVVRLLLESAPSIFETTPHFAMKGGTAINLFIEDMPRLSVDIDVVYTDHQATRDNALKSISSALETARKRLAIADVKAEVSSTKDGDEIKLFIRRGRNQVKVEVNHVFAALFCRSKPGGLARRRGNCSPRSCLCRSWSRRNFTAANSSPRWIASIRVTSSMFADSSSEGDSRRM